MSPPKVLICGDITWAHDDVRSLLGPIAQVVEMKSPHRSDFLQNVKPGEKYADIVGIYRHNSSSDFIGIFDAEIINSLPESLKWIAHNGAGYDQIDVAACKAKGIKVSNTPGAVDDATATTGMYLLISAARQFSIAEREARAGRWKSNLKPAHDPSALTLSILGLGGIGLQLAKLAHAFPMKRILYHSRHKRDDAPDWIEYCPDLHKMLAETDVLSVHVPLRRETEGFIGEKEIRALKKGAIIVNTARGKLIDEDALIRALEDGHLSAAGLDVYPDEPAINPRLLDFSNVTLLPHMGTETQESQRGMEVRALTNLRDYLTKGAGNDLIIEMKPRAKL